MLEKERKVYLHRVTDVMMMIMTRKFKVRGFLGSLATLTAILGVTAPAKAITFNFVNGDNGKTEINKTVGGLTLTLDDPRDFSGATVPFEANSTPGQETGLKLSSTTQDSPLPYSFQLNFSQDIRLVNYEVTNTEGDGVGDFFNLTQNSLTSNNNPVSALGTSPFTNTTTVFQGGVPIVFEAGDLLTSPVDTPDDEVFFLDNIQVELAPSAAVPFEFSPTLGLLAVGGIWGVSHFRKRVTTREVIDKLST